MKKLKRFLGSNFTYLAILVYLVSAFNSIGYIHPDEHFQILEFVSYKTGQIDSQQLPWEFEAGIRPTLQPWLAYAFTRFLAVLGIANPFLQISLLRVLTGLFSLAVILKLNGRMQNQFTSDFAKLFLKIASVLLWFVPYVMVHFSSETLSTLFFLAAIYYLIDSNVADRRLVHFLLAGALFALSFYARFQIGFAILGVGIWLVSVGRPRGSMLDSDSDSGSVSVSAYAWKLASMAFAFLLVSALCTLLDCLFYQEIVFTPLRYFHANIVEDVASNYGVSPWWAYFPMFASSVFHPIGLLLVVFSIVGISMRFRSIFAFALLPFLLAHMLIGHKEIRFLIPILYALMLLAAHGVDYLILNSRTKRATTIILRILLIPNLLLLLFRIILPAQEAFLYQRFIYNYTSKVGPTAIVYLKESPYNLVGIESSFYKPSRLAAYSVDSVSEIAALMTSQGLDQVLLFSKKTPVEVGGLEQNLAYSAFPNWMLKNNFNDWQSRARIWTIYHLATEK